MKNDTNIKLTPEYKRGSVSVALIYKGGLYLSRRIGSQQFYNKWQCAGGKLEENENPSDGAVREVLEETGIDIDAKRLRFVQYIRTDPTTVCCYFYLVELYDAEIPERKEPEKMTKWWRIDFDLALQFDLMPGVAQVIRAIKTNSHQQEDFKRIMDDIRKNR
jgi:ADP-ribose pyrophosphatase YjhB (NUDIX family)